MTAPDWKGLFEWSIKNQDTSKPQDTSQARQISDEDRKWFAEAMEAHTEDVYKRLRGIKGALESKADVPEDVDEKLRLLDDLTEIVENIDYARDLTHIGGLPTLLGLLQSQYAPVRASAAEVVATCVQNNPPVQQYFLEGGALPKLLKLTEDPDATARRKALLALSCLTRHCDPAMDAFREHGGLPLLQKAAADVSDPRQQRKALQLLREMVRQRSQDIREAVQGGLLGTVGSAVGSDRADVREAALALLALLVQHPGVVAVAKQDAALRDALQAAEQRLRTLDVEDQDAEREQLALVEHILEKLSSEQAHEDEPPGAAATQPASAAPAGVPDQAPEAKQEAEQRPVALLGPP